MKQPSPHLHYVPMTACIGNYRISQRIDRDRLLLERCEATDMGFAFPTILLSESKATIEELKKKERELKREIEEGVDVIDELKERLAKRKKRKI